MTDLPEDFSNHPKSVGEIRFERDRSAGSWSPRDVLINALRDLDSGTIKPDALVVVTSSVLPEGLTDVVYWNSGPNALITLGTMDNG